MTTTTQSPLELTFAEACDRGCVREENQDRVRHVTTPIGELIIVADGIGGYTGGGTAAQIVVDTVVSTIAAQPRGTSPARAIAEASYAANANIIAAAETGDLAYRRMGSTVVLALVVLDAERCEVWVGHIGDSRALRIRAGQLARLTRDHSTVQALLDQNVITPEQAKNHPDASVLTRSLGHHEDVEIDIDMFPLEDGDTILLCTDGLWGMVNEDAIAQVLAFPDVDLGGAAQALLALALQAGGHDNIGIQLVRCTSAQPAAAAPAPQTTATPKQKLPVPVVVALILLALVFAVLLFFYAEQQHLLPSLSPAASPDHGVSTGLS